MNISYSKLWKLLIDKGITKTELLELSGISSRTLAKLSHNESVTAETLAKICAALNCDIGDIISVANAGAPESVYAAFARRGAPCEETDTCKTYEVTADGVRYLISVTNRTANKYTFIHCIDNVIWWEQFPVLPRLACAEEKKALMQVKPKKDGIIRLFVISGKPGSINGLDDGIFRSARHPGGEGFIHVMSMAAFKVFTL